MRVRPGHNIRDLLRGSLSTRVTYQYEPLSSSNAIRLLQLQPSSGKGEIRCSLKTFDQGKAPPYYGLSYTWGYPLSPFSELSRTSSLLRLNFLQKVAAKAPKLLMQDGESLLPDAGVRYDSRYFPITCDGRTMLVTANLHDALQRLCGASSGIQDGHGAKHYWIDAICVDQENVAERNAQVARMAETYRAAESVLVWLGTHDQFTSDALALVEAIAALPRETRFNTKYTDFFDPAWHASAGNLTYRHWLGLLALLSRPWFRRAWVVQELAFARVATLVCGEQSVEWWKLERVLEFLRTKRWYHHLSTEKIGHLDSVRGNPGIYGEFLKSKAKLGVGVINLSRTRRWITKRELDPKRSGSLDRLIQMHRDTEASDPRDKVYAFLGLAEGSLNGNLGSRKGGDTPAEPSPAPRRTVLPVRPDYKLPVQEVYTDVTARLMLGHGDLRILSHVQDASHTSIQGLPSWVPDYSVPLQPYPLFFRGKVPWEACGPLEWDPDVEAMKNGRLHVQGWPIGTVEETALLPMETSGSAAYWSSIIQVAKGLDDYYLDGGLHGLGRDAKAQSRVEALWRTLITNIYSRKYPASPSVGALFLDYVLNLQVRHTLAPLSNLDFLPHQNPMRPAAKGVDNSAWHSLLAAEPAGSAYGKELYRERIGSVVDGMFRGVYNPIGLSQLQHEFDIASGTMRRVFRAAKTASDGRRELLLGTGPRSLQAGDEVWVLGSFAVPAILRKVPRGINDWHYAFVGESYVHGAMYWDENRMREGQGAVDIVLT